MAHFAQLDENNRVLQVIVVSDEHEATGEQWCHEFAGGQWKQTSRSGRIRKNFAGQGYVYDESRDAFIPPQPFSSWTLNEDTCRWDAPVPCPASGNYVWDESTQTWIPSAKLFYGNYGAKHPKKLVANAIAVYGLEPFVLKTIYQDDDFSLALTLVNNILMTSIKIQNTSAGIATRFLEKCNEIQRTVAMPIYAMDSQPNSAYADVTESPAWKIGSRYQFEFYENAVFNDKTYFVLRRTVDKATNT
jgi:hypothetical protein